jgi:hypothetical protein
MRTVSAVALCGIYIAAVLAGAPHVGPAMTPWFLIGLSAAFGWGYVAVAQGRKVTALSIVAVVTILLPVAALIALAWPLYRSPLELLASLWLEFRDRGLPGLLLLAPVAAASVPVFFARSDRHAEGR